MTLQEKINYVKNTAPNMVEVDGILNSVTEDYITKYANEVEKAPKADIYRSQVKWIGEAVRYFITEIHADKMAIWAAIPERFYRSHIYQRLAVSQFVKQTCPVS